VRKHGESYFPQIIFVFLPFAFQTLTMELRTSLDDDVEIDDVPLTLWRKRKRDANVELEQGGLAHSLGNSN
jgi:hypothetical protein